MLLGKSIFWDKLQVSFTCKADEAQLQAKWGSVTQQVSLTYFAAIFTFKPEWL